MQLVHKAIWCHLLYLEQVGKKPTLERKTSGNKTQATLIATATKLAMVGFSRGANQLPGSKVYVYLASCQLACPTRCLVCACASCIYPADNAALTCFALSSFLDSFSRKTRTFKKLASAFVSFDLFTTQTIPLHLCAPLFAFLNLLHVIIRVV